MTTLQIVNKVLSVVVVERQTPFVLRPLYQSGAVGPAGVDGHDGIDGAPGANGAGFTYQQVSPSDTWTINHNLGLRPSVSLFTTGGQEMIGEVLHTSNNQTVVSFNGAVAGIARLN